MGKSVDIYWPRAEVAQDDSSVAELKVEEGLTKLLYAWQRVKEWRDAYGDRVHNARIDVCGLKRKKYTINITEGSKIKRNRTAE